MNLFRISFPPVKTAVSHADRSATLPAKERRVRSSEDGVGLHTVQLLPVVLPGTITAK